jgi:hypothetical protein
VDDAQTRWLEQRRQAVAAHGAALERRRAAETEEALRLVAEFTREAHARGLRLTSLTARAYDGRAAYRTGLRGWYLRPDRTLAVGTDGGFYILTVPATFQARLTGVRIRPQDPRLVVGEGGRDGESMPLRALLRQRLDAGDDWP